MKIDGTIWLEHIVDKLIEKHNVETDEVDQVFDNSPKYRFVEKGKRKNEDVYLALGRSDAGRYLVAIFIYKENNEALILSAREMIAKERKQYAKK